MSIRREGTTSQGAANSFSVIQPDAGTSPTADSTVDTITFTSSDATVTITGDATTDTIDFKVTTPGGANVFKTIDCPSGTDPVADSATDTLTLATSNSLLTITGDSTTDTVTFAVVNSAIDHGTLAGLTDDDHTQYPLIAGRSGGQSITGGTGAGEDLTLVSTSHATKGEVIVTGRFSSGSGTNTNTGTYSTALGTGNTASNFYSFAAGIDNNSTNIASMALGSGCSARGAYSSAIGHLCDTYGDWSHLKGRRLYGVPGSSQGAHMLGDSDPDSASDLSCTSVDRFHARFKKGWNYYHGIASGPLHLVRQATVATTNNTQTTLLSFTSETTKSYLIEARVAARQTGGTAGTVGDTAVYVVRALAKNIAGTLTVSNVTADFTAEDQAGWDATIDGSGLDVRVRVTGATDNNITWNVTFKVDQV